VAGALSVPGLLAACGTTQPLPAPGNVSGQVRGQGPGGLQLARPNVPVSLPIYPDNKPIPSGMKPEKGPLQFYNWQEYISPKVVTSFEKKYGVQVQISTFTTLDEAIAKLESRAVQYDVFCPETPDLEQLVVGKILRPLNLDYIPNLEANAWPAIVNPWYDYGSQYTVPYTVYTTGYGWRTDKLKNFSPEQYSNPWSALWEMGPKIPGLVGMLDDQHDGMALGLLHTGTTDVNTSSEAALTKAQNAISELVSKANLKFDTNEYQQLANGSIYLHQAWSGDLAAAPLYAPKGVPPTAFAYWWPKDGKGPIDNDMLGIVRGGANPVLAHLFLNHVLEVEEAFSNYSYILYQQPLKAMTPGAVVSRKLVAPNLQNTLIEEAQFKQGYVSGPLSTEAASLWENAWAAVRSS